MKNSIKSQFVGVSVFALLISAPAFAQEGADPQGDDGGAGIEEIVVTAQKRSESLQKTPAAVTALSGDSLVQSGTTDLRAVQNLVPAARFQQEGATTQVVLRGIGSNLDFGNVEPVVAFNVNGVYTPREGTSQPLFDLERIEILPGPQGTLYGRNALGGTVNVSFKRPTQDLETSGMIELGNHDLVHATLVQNLPLSESLAVRAAVDYTYHDGYMTSGAYSKKDFAGRLGVLYKPNDDFSLYVWGSGVDKSGAPANLVNKGTDPVTGGFSENAFLNSNPWDDQRRGIWANATPPQCSFIAGVFGSCTPFGTPKKEAQTYHLWNFGAQMDVGLGEGLTLSYIPGYFSLDSNSKYWLGIIPATKTDNYRMLTQELRLSGDSDRLQWLLGVYAYTQKTVGDFVVDPFFISSRVLHHRVKGVALFGQATYSVSDSLRLTVGGRGSFDKRTANGISLADQTSPYTYDQSFSRFDYKIGMEYDIAPNVMGYFTYQTGYQPGTFNEIPETATVTNQIAAPKMTSYTGGLKTRFAGNSVQINVEGFYYDYKDLLVQAYNASLPYNQIFNAKARNYGFQVDSIFQPTDNDRLNISFAYLNARLTKYAQPGLAAYEGFSPPYAADWTLNIGYYHDFQMSSGYLRAAADARYEGAYFADFVHTPGVRQKPAWTENASLTYYSANGGWSAGIWGKNLSNEAILAATAAAGLPGPATAYLQEPRTFGGRVTFKF